MHRLAYLLFIPAFLSIQLSAQEMPIESRTEIDSLLISLPSSNTDQKVDILLKISKKYLCYSIDSSKEYARQALINAKQQNNDNNIAEAYKSLGGINYYEGNFNDGVSYYDSSLQYFSRAGDSAGMAKIWNNLGVIYQNVGNFHKAIDFYLSSLRYKLKTSDTLGIINTYNNIGSIYYELKDYSKSEQHFNNALILSEKYQHSDYMEFILNNLALIYMELHQYEKSIEILNKAFKLSNNKNDLHQLSSIYHNFGKCYYLMGEPRKALDQYFLVIKLNERIGVKNALTYNNIAQVYIDLDYLMDALEYLKLGVKIAEENNQFSTLVDLYYNLSLVFERLGQYEKAYYNYLLFNKYDDSLKSQMYSDKVNNISEQVVIESTRAEFEKVQLASQLELEKKDSQINLRNYIIYSFFAGIIAILIIAIILLKMFRQKNRANTILKHQNDEILRSDKIIKNINKALTENEEMLRSIYDASPFSILIISPDFKIINCNNASLSLFGVRSKRDIIKIKMDHLFAQDQLKMAKDHFQTAFDTSLLEKQEYTLIKNDGTTFNAEINGGLIKDNAGNFSACVLIITDITERLSFIENLKLAKSEAEESDRLKTAFLANMSHEIRTPMNSIIGFSNLLNDSDLKQDKKDQYLQHIFQSSNLLLNLIDDIIDISKIEAGQITINLQICNLNETIKDLFFSAKETHKNKSIELRLNLPKDSDAYIVKTDPYRLRQVLTNLLGNAIKFTDSGYVEIGYALRNSDQKAVVEFFVKDSGIGIPKEKQNIIFDRFRQVDDSRSRKYGGTGLGLAISKRLVDLLGGNIWVESEPNKGSEFYFSLPFANGKLEPVETPLPFIANKYDWSDKIILIAEDENSNFELLKASLQRTKIKIVRAVDGEEAVNYVKNHNSVDLILMDIRMPKMNGYDATRHIKSIKPQIPVISITAFAMSEDENKSIEAGCDKYISKPIRPSILLDILSKFLGTN